MSQHLPVLSGRSVVAVFGRAGWVFVRQAGSHMILVKDGEIVSLSVPDHREVARGTLRSLIRSAGMTVDEFVELSRSK